MKILVDTDRALLRVEDAEGQREMALHSPEAFEVLSREWLRVGWGQRYSYRFSWLGRPLIQLPQDLMRMQELIVAQRPDLLIETGVAHGGSLVFHASLFELLGHGRVVGVDVEIRPHNREAIETHPLAGRISLIEGDAIAEEIVARVRDHVRPDERVMVILDSNHTKAHVAGELAAYSDFVSPGQYLVVEDGSMRDLHDVPGGDPSWIHDNPLEAAREFLTARPDFELAPPPPPFLESEIPEDPNTYWPEAWLRRKG